MPENPQDITFEEEDNIEHTVSSRILAVTQFVTRKTEEAIMQAVGREMLKELEEDEELDMDVLIQAISYRCICKREVSAEHDDQELTVIYLDDKPVIKLGDITFTYANGVATYSHLSERIQD
ncbi:MAG: hypothetical protein ACPG32_02655 [Akkermansiaceae bacterium]